MSVFRNQFLENLITTPFPLLTPFLPHPLPFNFPLGWEFPGSASWGLGEGRGSCFIREDNLIGTTDLNNSPSKGPGPLSPRACRTSELGLERLCRESGMRKGDKRMLAWPDSNPGGLVLSWGLPFARHLWVCVWDGVTMVAGMNV